MEEAGQTLNHFPFLALPSELQLNTLVWLAPLVANQNNNGALENSGKDLFHCHLVCKQFLEVLQQERFWQMVLQTSSVVEEGCSSLPHDVHSWKQLYQLQFIHLEAAAGSEKYLRIDNRRRSVTITGTHSYHTRVYASCDWYSGRHYWEVMMDHVDTQVFAGVLPSKACNTHNGIIGHSSEPGWSIIPYTGEIKGNCGSDRHPPPSHFQWFKDGNVIGICLDIDEGRLDYWYNGVYLTGIQKESIKQNGPYRAAVSLMKQGEKATFNFYARMPTTDTPPRRAAQPTEEEEEEPSSFEDGRGLFD
ncbi:hypothetical protein QOT17_014991 [Balamuthia mandrillaris]